jgi:glycosyltransferase involved in cell wall biosynthesis
LTSAPRTIRSLTFSTLYPNAVDPSHGIFVETRLRHLLAAGAVATEVVAPVPWFPFAGARFGRYGKLARVAGSETRHGIAVAHPRYLVIPRIGMLAAPWLLYQGARRAARRVREAGFDFDLIDAHYFYPDGIAAALLAAELGRPLIITARGTDINLIADDPLPRRMILWAARRAFAMVTVCQALKDRLVEIGAPADKIRVLRNGVNLALFRPGDRAAARARLGLDGPTILSVGHLIPRKGHDIVIRAVARLPGVRLLIAGDGPEQAALETLSGALGVTDRVRFLGRLPQAALPELYGAADLLVLASDREGWANVLLEAMACGTAVAASDIWGTPEVVADPAAGLLVRERTGEAFAGAIAQLLAAPPDRAATRAYAEGFSWDATTAGQIELFTAAAASR